MLSLKVHNKIITWPEDIAVFMMNFYEKLEIPYEVQKNDTQNEKV